jgi:hypothetical protein
MLSMLGTSPDRVEVGRSSKPLLGRLSCISICGALLLALLGHGDAQAKAHLWDMLRVFSNEDGNVQFIDMFVSDPAGTGEYFLLNKTLTSNASEYVFPNNLANDKSTFQTWVLIATQDYADLPGAPTPDYIIPPQFFDPAGDELHYRNTVDVFTIPPGAMPTDGVRMLERDLSTPVNLGTNYAGDDGTVTLAAIRALGDWAAIAAALLLMSLGSLALLARGRRNPRLE